jgi:hypothetical protein
VDRARALGDQTEIGGEVLPSRPGPVDASLPAVGMPVPPRRAGLVVGAHRPGVVTIPEVARLRTAGLRGRLSTRLVDEFAPPPSISRTQPLAQLHAPALCARRAAWRSETRPSSPRNETDTPDRMRRAQGPIAENRIAAGPRAKACPAT